MWITWWRRLTTSCVRRPRANCVVGCLRFVSPPRGFLGRCLLRPFALGTFIPLSPFFLGVSFAVRVSMALGFACLSVFICLACLWCLLSSGVSGPLLLPVSIGGLMGPGLSCRDFCSSSKRLCTVHLSPCCLLHSLSPVFIWLECLLLPHATAGAAFLWRHFFFLMGQPPQLRRR